MNNLLEKISFYNDSALFDYDGTKFTYTDLYDLVVLYNKTLINKSVVFIDATTSAVHTLAIVISCMMKNNIAILVPQVNQYDFEYIKNKYGYTHIIKGAELIYSPNGVLNYPADVNIILFTSGTSGNQKGVMLTKDNLMRNVESGVEHYNIECKSPIVNILPLYHGFGLNVASLALLYYGCDIYYANLANYFSLVNRISPTYFFVTPEIFRMHIDMHDFKSFNKSFGFNPKYIFCGGNFVPKYYYDYCENNNLILFMSYGLTEASPSVSAENFYKRKKGSVGVPISCNRVEIYENEIIIEGQNVMYGYYEDYINGHILPIKHLQTGDYGMKDEDGFLYVTGRKKNLIIFSNGEKILAEAIENKLKECHPKVDFYVYTKKDVLYVAYHGACSIDEIRQILSTIISPFHLHAIIESVNKPFEKTYVGKIIRNR